MRPGPAPPRFAPMKSGCLFRIAAVAAVTGAVTQLVASALEPDWSGDPRRAALIVSRNGFWTGDRLLDLLGALLAVGPLTVVGHTFAGGPGEEWVRASQPFLVLMGALGAGAIAVGATLQDLANAWVDAGPAGKHAYLASFDGTAGVTENLFFCAFLALGLYLATLAAGILIGSVYARWIGWVAAASAALVLVGDPLELIVDGAFVAVLGGFAL